MLLNRMKKQMRKNLPAKEKERLREAYSKVLGICGISSEKFLLVQDRINHKALFLGTLVRTIASMLDGRNEEVTGWNRSLLQNRV